MLARQQHCQTQLELTRQHCLERFSSTGYDEKSTEARKLCRRTLHQCTCCIAPTWANHKTELSSVGLLHLHRHKECCRDSIVNGPLDKPPDTKAEARPICLPLLLKPFTILQGACPSWEGQE
eukprot:2898656-Amphidinium_carterae.1